MTKITEEHALDVITYLVLSRCNHISLESTKYEKACSKFIEIIEYYKKLGLTPRQIVDLSHEVCYG